MRNLSGGMVRRVGIAQAMLNDPKILILDEPTAGLDPNERIRFRNLISELAEERLVLLSTHIVSDVEFIANKIVLMKEGQCCFEGTSDEVIASIQTAIVQGMKAPKPVVVQEKQEKEEERVQEKPMQLKSAYTSPSPIFVQNYNSTKVSSYHYASDDIFAAENKPILIAQIRKIVENEAPISKALLGKKILSEWGISRLGPRIDAYLETIFDTLHLYRIEHDGLVFCWKDEAQYRSYTEYRPDSDRDAADLPPEETANAIRQILTDSISLPLPDLIKACAQIFGFARMGSNIEASMLRGIQEAVKKNYARVENGRATIIG